MTAATPDLIACPVCDGLYRLPAQKAAEPARCVRCGYRLSLGKRDAIARVVGLALASAILMTLVVFLPFLELESGSFKARASVIDVVFAFQSASMALLSLAVLAFIVLLPIARFGLLAYALAPVLFAQPPRPGALTSLRYAFLLKPWAMAEIFMVGVAVALVKLAGMANLAIGPAFWSFVAVVLLTAYKDTLMCRNTLWNAVSSPPK